MTLHQAYPMMITSILLLIHSMLHKVPRWFKVCQFRVKSEVQTLRIESGVDFKSVGLYLQHIFKHQSWLKWRDCSKLIV